MVTQLGGTLLEENVLITSWKVIKNIPSSSESLEDYLPNCLYFQTLMTSGRERGMSSFNLSRVLLNIPILIGSIDALESGV